MTQRDAPRLRAALYLRMSLDRTGEGAGVERQESACRALADARGWDVVRTFVDNSVSASKGVRPQWEALLEHARAGQHDIVVAWALDRLVRRSSDLERLVETGVRAATVQGDLDLTTVQGELLAGILASVARAEVRQKGERQRAANLQRAQAGDVGWTRRPFGYDRADGDVVLVPAEATALQAAAAEVLTGGTVAAAARGIDRAGLTTTAGKPWNVTTLRRALLNPRYAGRAVYRGEDHGVGAWPVILSADVQQRLEDVLRDPSRRVQQGTQLRHLLSGLVRCGRCGATMRASPMGGAGRSRYMGYKCAERHLVRRLDHVDEVVVAVVLARLAQPDAAGLLAPDVDLDRLRLEAVELRRRRDELAELLAEGLLTAAKVREQTTVLAERLRTVEQQLAHRGTTPLATLALADDVAATWDALDVRSRRGVVDELMTVTVLPAGKGVRWSPEQVRIDWKA